MIIKKTIQKIIYNNTRDSFFWKYNKIITSKLLYCYSIFQNSESFWSISIPNLPTRPTTSILFTAYCPAQLEER